MRRRKKVEHWFMFSSCWVVSAKIVPGSGVSQPYAASLALHRQGTNVIGRTLAEKLVRGGQPPVERSMA
jgi:hypothetical protein